jgi:hypothetical protein
MNAHILTSPTTHWWWPAAAAGAVTLAAVGAITVGPALFEDSPTVADAPTAPKVSYVAPVRACLHGPAHWNPAVHGQPSGCVRVDEGPGSLSGSSGGVRNPDRELAIP